MKKFSQKTIDIIQWVLIIGLLAMLVIQGINYRKLQSDLVTAVEYNKDNTYVRIYESKNLNKLKNENKELYDSISKLNNVESGMVIKFREHYKTDTISVEKFIVNYDTVRIVIDDENIYENIDSVYRYTENNDTVNLNIDVKASKLKWINADFTINDKFMIINRNNNNVNETTISHSDNATIESTTMWHKKDNSNKWYNRLHIGPQVGVGYGFMNKNFDTFIGFGGTYDIIK